MGKEDRLFILGLGAQKAGTTWLHAYLNSFPESDMGRCKEYHVWDGISLPKLAEYDIRANRLGLIRRVKSTVMETLCDRPDRLVLRQDLQRDPDTYFLHFARLLSRDGIRLTGDFTPSYSGLHEEILKQLRDGFERLSIRFKAVFLMRDPLKRALSAIQMYHRDTLRASDGGSRFQGVDMDSEPETALLSYLDTEDWRLRGDYPAIVSRLERVIYSENIYLGFYETMFSESEFYRFNKFFDVLPNEAFLSRFYNKSSSGAPLPEPVRQQAMHKLAPVYEWAFQRWPELKCYWEV